MRPRESLSSLQDVATAADVRRRETPATFQDAATIAIGATGRLGMLQVRIRADLDCYR